MDIMHVTFDDLMSVPREGISISDTTHTRTHTVFHDTNTHTAFHDTHTHTFRESVKAVVKQHLCTQNQCVKHTQNNALLNVFTWTHIPVYIEHISMYQESMILTQ